MKRFIAVPLAAAALLVPAAASGTQMTGDSGTTKGTDFTVSFRVLTQGNKPVAVKHFKFKNLPVDCDPQGAQLLSGSISGQFPVNDHRFHGTADDPAGGQVKVKGRFKNHNHKVVGKVRAEGDFDGGSLTNCSGVLGYVAT